MKIKGIFVFVIMIFILTFSCKRKLVKFDENLQITPTPTKTWVLIWQDEFNGTDINSSNWSFDIGSLYGGWGNNELQYYTSRTINAYIENGNLIIQALAENYNGYNYTSARIKSINKIYFKYGKIEARIKLPYGQGIWPAFWMMGKTGTWPACGEIDIMEMIGGGIDRDNKCYGTVHWDDNGHKQAGGSISLNWPEIFANDYHVFGVEWNEEKIKWFLDGIKYYEIDITPPTMKELHQEFYILLNVAVGGNWPGAPDMTTSFPQKMYVDWVRWYKWQ
ncbi:MAG: glycoside hydrolase family 16 protein [Candidatus Goldbacteria bacterium]|nr:glycoside hydrolase family 16 protein [Candidatus Goldiibacteriota bacterium]